MNELPSSEQSVFLEALEKQTLGERAAYLDAACGNDASLRADVEALLEAHARIGEGDTGLVEERPGAAIGPYRLVEKIADGGMGRVFVAEQQQPVYRRVALKVIKPGMDTRQVISRFEAERQALALMDHPAVARVLDAGATSNGRPYFVMELIQGVPITEYCDRCDLTTRERLELFTQVCRGIQHAHQKGIIHRDIKPSNVLVAIQDGHHVAKVIDFGVAKAINQPLAERGLSTGFAQMLGTPLYMSPEQAELSPIDLDTRTDIYSLGVLLYELLTGTTPFEKRQLGEASFDAIRRTIRDVDPPTPSLRINSLGDKARPLAERRRTDARKLRQLLRGELDWIVMKALEKDRARRYETASALAMDVERYLKEEPVEACPPSRSYRLRKFARRNRVALTIAGCFVLLVAVLLGGVGWVVRDQTARRMAIEREVTRAMGEVISWIGRDRLAEAQASLKQAEALVAAHVVNEELLGELRNARSELEMVASLARIRSEKIREREGRFDWSDVDAAYAEFFRGYGVDSDVPTASEVAARIRASPIRQELLAGIDNWILAKSMCGSPGRERLLEIADKADTDTWRSSLRAATEARDRNALVELARDERALRQPPADIVLLQHALDAVGEPSVSIDVFRQVQVAHPDDFWINLGLGNALVATAPTTATGYFRAALATRPDSAGAWLQLGYALYHSGEMEDAVIACRRATRLDPGAANGYLDLGTAYSALGKKDEAVDAWEQAIRLDPEFAAPHYNLAGVFRDRGDTERMMSELRRVLELDPNMARARHRLGVALAGQGRLEEALVELRLSVQLDPKLAVGYAALAAALTEKGDLDAAEGAYREALALDPKSATTHYNFGVLLERRERSDDAIASFRRSIELDGSSAKAHSNLGMALQQQGKIREALILVEKAVQLAPESWEVHHNLGTVLGQLGRLDEAVARFRQAVALGATGAGVHRALGLALGRKGDVTGAVAELRKATEIDPEDPGALRDLAIGLSLTGELQEAAESLRRAAVLDPRSADTQYGLGVVLGESKDLDGAIAAYRRALELEPEHAKAQNNLAMALRQQGNLDEAIAHYRKAAALLPQSLDVRYNLANALAERGTLEEAITLYREVIARDANYAEAHLNLGEALRARGAFSEALDSLKRAHEIGSRNPRWRYPTAQLIAECEQLLDHAGKDTQ